MSQETEKFGPEPLIGEGSIRIKSPALKAIEKSLLQNFNDLGALFMMPRLMATTICLISRSSTQYWPHSKRRILLMHWSTFATG